jgi:soluble lytic murein transglycosylase-like protein
MQPQKAIVPGILLGSLILILVTRLLTPAQSASAATQEPVQSALIASTTCSLASIPDNITQWCGLIEAAAVKYGVSPELVAAVMLQESGGQADVISASGAVGLMQVMPSDGIAAGFMCVNGPCFATRPTTQELLDPAFNVDYGVRMLAGLIEKYGNERDALKAYGPYNVEYYYADKVLNIKGNL